MTARRANNLPANSPSRGATSRHIPDGPKIWLPLFALFAVLVCFEYRNALAAEVVVVGDTALAPVNAVIAGIRSSSPVPIAVHTVGASRGRLKEIVDRDGGRLVIALGRDAMEEAFRLPVSIPVIYALVVTPPSVARPNSTGFYMATPPAKYLETVQKYLPTLSRIAVVGSSETAAALSWVNTPTATLYAARTPMDFIATIRRLNGVDAIVILPDVDILTATAMEEAYLISFKKQVPLLGIGKKHVRQGSLFALVFQPEDTGRLIGDRAGKILQGKLIAGNIAPSSSRDFDLFINTDTAKQMHIELPQSLLRKAIEVYP